MASKLLTTIFITFLIFFFFVSSSTTAVVARPVPGPSNTSTRTTRDRVVNDALEEESCDGIGEEYCLMRKTLAAHADYIYSDKQEP